MILQIEYIKNAIAGYERKSRPVPHDEEWRCASVLVPLVQQNNKLHILLTKRTDDVETHKGQISFPGGMNDSEDIDAVATALREAEEEIGLSRSSVEIIGAFDDFLTPSKFLITPIVGYITSLPILTVNPAEVADVLLVPLSFFADNRNGRTEQRTLLDKTVTVWFFEYKGHTIWGATAAMIKRFLDILISQEEQP